MPELPEVETIRRDLARTITGLKFKKILIRDPRVVRMPAGEFICALEGQEIAAVHRRGKALLLDLKGLWFVVQPMMTGQLVHIPSGREVPILKETKAVFELSKGVTLLYNDQRLFGRLQVVKDLHTVAHLKTMGPEPLEKEFTVGSFAAQLAERNVAVKTLLLDHKVIAGIGNIYASESLFLAGLSPTRKAGSLKSAEVARLHKAIRDVLLKAIRMRGTSVRNYRDGYGMPGSYLKVIKVYGRDGKPCLKCGTLIRRIVQAQRSTFFCQHCQR